MSVPPWGYFSCSYAKSLTSVPVAADAWPRQCAGPTFCFLFGSVFHILQVVQLTVSMQRLSISAVETTLVQVHMIKPCFLRGCFMLANQWSTSGTHESQGFPSRSYSHIACISSRSGTSLLNALTSFRRSAGMSLAERTGRVV